MSRPRAQLLALIAASVLGTAIVAWLGGGKQLLEPLAHLEQQKSAVLLAFMAWAMLANCLVLPAGSLSLVAGGALFGAILPAVIWFAAQLLTAPLIYRTGVGNRAGVAPLVARYLGPSAARLMSRAARDGVWSTVLLRLTPVLPSAAACLIAAWAGIAPKSFMLGSALAGWVRPLYFASIGAAVGSLSQAHATMDAWSLQTLITLAIPCVGAAAILGVRLHVLNRLR